MADPLAEVWERVRTLSKINLATRDVEKIVEILAEVPESHLEAFVFHLREKVKEAQKKLWGISAGVPE